MYGIATNDRSAISPHDLDTLLVKIKSSHPHLGEVMVRGHLQSLGLRVPRSQVRESIHRVDPEGVELRKSRVVKRRQYFVESPNSVWHVDGHHKLIKWRFVIHAAIDGFSRVIPYIHCSDNNRANTVLQAFNSGVMRFGLPKKVRSDHGGENIEVWRYMLSAHNGDSRCIITGSSTHNERIERLWRDVHRGISHFSDIFHELECEGLLDLLNEVDMFSLHYVYLPIINKCLHDFQESWNNHNLSTEGNMTPYQLFAEGMNYAAELAVPATMHNVSPLQIPAIPNNQPFVETPRISFFPCTTLVNQLQLHASNNTGKQLYIEVIGIIGQHLLNDCSNCQ